jgi:hypothetical protein
LWSNNHPHPNPLPWRERELLLRWREKAGMRGKILSIPELFQVNPE